MAARLSKYELRQMSDMRDVAHHGRATPAGCWLLGRDEA